MAVGWSGNPVIKRGARGKSRELILSPHHRIRNFTRSCRAYGLRLEPLGAELSGVERSGDAAFTCRRPGRAQHSARRRTRYRRRGGRAVLWRPACGRAMRRRRSVGMQGWEKASSSHVLVGRAASRHGCDPKPQPVRCGGGSLPLSRAHPLPRPEGGSSLRSEAVVLHLSPAALNLEPSRLLLRRCSPFWHRAGGFLGEVSEGLSWGSLQCIRALHLAARAASTTESPSFSHLPPWASVERFTFKCPHGGHRWSCHSEPSPSKT